MRNFRAAQVWPKFHNTRRPIKATAERLDCCFYSLLQAFWPSKYNDFLAKNPLAVLGGISEAERAAFEPLDSEVTLPPSHLKLPIRLT